MTRRKGKIQVSENTVGNPRALAVSMPRWDGTGQKHGVKYAPALKNRLDLAFAKIWLLSESESGFQNGNSG